MNIIDKFIKEHIADYKSKYPKSNKFDSELRNFISYFKGTNGYKPYSLEELENTYRECVKNPHSYYTYSPIYETINTNELLDLINRIHYQIKLYIFIPDHEYCPKHTYSCEVEEADSDMFHVEVYSSKGLVKSYDISAIGITFEKMYDFIDKERNNCKP